MAEKENRQQTEREKARQVLVEAEQEREKARQVLAKADQVWLKAEQEYA